jgi:transposase
MEQTASREKVSVSQIVLWTLRREDERTERQSTLLECLSRLCEPFQKAFMLAQRFLTFIRQNPRTDQTSAFREWLKDALSSEVTEMRSFARGLQCDRAAVEAGLSLPWGNGAVEGSVHRLKFIKRRGYGRANFDLLRRRVLQPI